MPNQTPEEKARYYIDKQLFDCGWDVQSKSKILFYTVDQSMPKLAH